MTEPSRASRFLPVFRLQRLVCVWCSPGSPPAPSLTIGPWHQTQTEPQSGGEEGRKNTSKTDNSERKTTASHRSVSAYTSWQSSRVLPELFLMARRKAEWRWNGNISDAWAISKNRNDSSCSKKTHSQWHIWSRLEQLTVQMDSRCDPLTFSSVSCQAF